LIDLRGTQSKTQQCFDSKVGINHSDVNHLTMQTSI